MSSSVIKSSMKMSMVMSLKLKIAKNIIFFFTNSYAKPITKTFKIKLKAITMTISKNTIKLKSQRKKRESKKTL